MAQIISSYWPLEFCAGRNRWQKRVYSKATFPEALELYNCIQEALGRDEIGMEDIKKISKKKKARTRGRRGKRRGISKRDAKTDSEGRLS